MRPRRLLNPTAETAGTTKTETTAVDGTEGFKAALKKHGDDATSLARESWTKASEAERQVNELRGKLPKDGAVVLEGDDLAEWNAFKGLGKSTEVITKLGTLGTLETTIAAHNREKLISAASLSHGSAGPLGYDPEVLGSLIGADTVIEIKDGKDRLGKPAKLAEVVEQVEGEEVRTALDKFMEKHFAKFLPSLKVADSKGSTAIRPPSGLPRTESPRDLNPQRTLRAGQF